MGKLSAEITIDLTREHPIRLSDVPKLPWLRRLHRRIDGSCPPLHTSTIYRWTMSGLRGRRLEYVQLAGTRVTTEAALLRFFKSLTTQRTSTSGSRTPQSRKHKDQIERELDAAGL